MHVTNEEECATLSIDSSRCKLKNDNKNNSTYQQHEQQEEQQPTITLAAAVESISTPSNHSVTTRSTRSDSFSSSVSDNYNYTHFYGSISVNLALGRNSHNYYHYEDSFSSSLQAGCSQSPIDETTSLIPKSKFRRSNSSVPRDPVPVDIIELIPPTYITTSVHKNNINRSPSSDNNASPNCSFDETKMTSSNNRNNHHTTSNNHNSYIDHQEEEKLERQEQPSLEIYTFINDMPLEKRNSRQFNNFESEMIEFHTNDHDDCKDIMMKTRNVNHSCSGEDEKTDRDEIERGKNYYFAEQPSTLMDPSSSISQNVLESISTPAGSPSKLKTAQPNINNNQPLLSSRRSHSFPSTHYNNMIHKNLDNPTTINENQRRPQSPLLSKKSRSLSFHHKSYIANDIDEINFEYQFLSTVDRIEEEFDRNAYEQLIPFTIRMELENRLFGWSHLYSEAFGHVLFPLLYYFVTFSFLSIVGLTYISSSDDEHCLIIDTQNDVNNDCQCGWYCTFHKVSFQGHGDNIGIQYKPIFGISPKVFIFTRQLLSVWSAFNAFRTVRRRRRVWLRSTAAEYFKDEKMRDEIKEVDKSTLLGKIGRKVRERRIKKKIQKAGKRFEKRQKLRRNNFISSSSLSSYESQHHIKVSKLGSKPKDVKEEWNEDMDNSYVLSHSDGVTVLSHHDSSKDLDPNDFLEVYQKYKHVSQEDLTHPDEKHFYARTMPTFAMQSINMDQIRLKSRIQNVPYAHGGFFGAAPFMLANPHWIDILRELMPDVYVEISRRVVHTPVPQLIHWAENNPVVAAFGTAHELEFSGKVPTLEWDVFLDPHLVRRVEVVLQARDSFLVDIAKSSKPIYSILNRNGMTCSSAQQIKAISIILESNTSKYQDERRILEFYNTEIDKRVNLVMENMLIAHGNASQLMLEQTGMLKNFNFSRVKLTRRTLGGGIFAKHWITTFVQALKMSTKSRHEFSRELSNHSESSHEEGAHSSSSYDKEETPLLYPNADIRQKEKGPSNDLDMSVLRAPTIAESINALKEITECDAPLGILLDVKSRHVSKRVWAFVLESLRKAGARIEGIGTFFIEDIRDVSKLCSVPVKEIIFFHSAGDLQHACHSGSIRHGDSIFFNAGSLFWNNSDYSSLFHTCLGSFDAEEVKRNYKLQPYARISKVNCKEKRQTKDDSNDTFAFLDGESSTIQEYKRHFNLSIGLYVQEFIIDDKILGILIDYVNKNQHVYNLGLSWGGINGLTVQGIQPSRFTSTDGLWNQRYIGNKWNSTCYPTIDNSS